MKILEVNQNGSSLPTVKSFDLKSGHTIKAVTLGEEGRGRRLTLIPVPPKFEDGDKLEENFKIGATRTGKPRLDFSDDTSKDVIVLLKPTYGFRGSVVFNLHGIEPLSEGEIAQGDAGRMGGNSQYLIAIPDGKRVEFERRGRLYGSPSEWVVENRDGEIFVFPKEEEDYI